MTQQIQHFVWQMEISGVPNKSEAKEDHQLSPGGPSNRRKSSFPNQLKRIAFIWYMLEHITNLVFGRFILVQAHFRFLS